MGQYTAEETAKLRATLLEKARALIGTTYDSLDCSHFVHKAYEDAGLKYPYANTAAFSGLVGTYFSDDLTESELEPGDLVCFAGHIGIYDPDGCKIVNTAECQKGATGKLADYRILSARSGKNLGVEYGRSSWWTKKEKPYLRWKDFAPPTR